MKIGINKYNQIEQIDNITDSSLTVVELDENSIDFPFKNWSRRKN